MKITDILISIPPYISTTWDNVVSLHTEQGSLVIQLKNSPSVIIPDLPDNVIDQIFQTHSTYLETHPQLPSKQAPIVSFEQLFTLPLNLNLRKGELFGAMLQHDPAHRDLPPIPEEVAQKLAPIAEMVSEEALASMSPAESGCNCMYCQIYRILGRKFIEKEHLHPLEEEGEPVHDHELRFQTDHIEQEWAVTHLKDKLYKVARKDDPQEQYTVFLGDPIGCTCGKSNCEHIIAVLRS